MTLNKLAQLVFLTIRNACWKKCSPETAAKQILALNPIKELLEILKKANGDISRVVALDSGQSPIIKFPCADCPVYCRPNHGFPYCGGDHRCSLSYEWRAQKDMLEANFRKVKE